MEACLSCSLSCACFMVCCCIPCMFELLDGLSSAMVFMVTLGGQPPMPVCDPRNPKRPALKCFWTEYSLYGLFMKLNRSIRKSSSSPHK